MPRLLPALLCPALLCSVLLTGCAEANPTVVALLVADGSTELGQTVDPEVFQERVQATCDGCELAVYDAGGEAATQEEQVGEALAGSADVLVVDPVDPERAEAFVGRVGEVPLVAYATLVPGAEAFVGLESDLEIEADGATNDLQAAREVIEGRRRQMVHVPARAMSQQAADVAVGLVAGEPVEGATDHEGVPSWLFTTTEVTRENLTSVLVAEGAMTLEELCAGEPARACVRLGFR